MPQTIEEAGSGDRLAYSDLIAYIGRHMVCDRCMTPYAADDVVAARREDVALLLVATCPACQVERLVTAYQAMPWNDLWRGEPVIPGKITEATVNEWSAFLSAFGGDCYDLLAGG